MKEGWKRTRREGNLAGGSGGERTLSIGEFTGGIGDGAFKFWLEIPTDLLLQLTGMKNTGTNQSLF